jgi:predicted dehydrogenase
MKRYDAGNELVRETIAAWQASGAFGRPLYARAHGYGGDWTAGIDLPPMETVAETPPPAPTEENLPVWLPARWGRSYVSYLQQYTHNFNLLRYFLGAGDRVRVKHADLDPDGYTGVVILDVDGVRATVETGSLRHHRWDEHTQVYFERGWLHTWAPPLLLRNAVAEGEIYRNEESGGANASAGGVQHTITRAIPEPRWSWAYKREAMHFVQCLRDNLPFRSTAEDTLTDVRLFEEIYRMWLQV